jgi:hypothetical protein
VFLDDESGAVWQLDILEGDLARPSAAARRCGRLDTEEGQDRHLLAGLALGAHHRLGTTPGDHEVLAWTLPPILGGPVDAENLQTMDFEVWLSIAGQLHHQVKDLPPCTPITGFTMAEDAPPTEGRGSKKKRGWFGGKR